MSVSLFTADLRRVLSDIQSRIGILERRITSSASVDTSYEITFSFAGTITAIASPPKRVWKGGDLGVLAVTMDTAGSTATIIDIERNGTVVATVTVPSSTEVYNGEVSARFAPDDILGVSVTTAGTGAADMTCDARFT
jgi:hypothetical protein